MIVKSEKAERTFPISIKSSIPMEAAPSACQGSVGREWGYVMRGTAHVISSELTFVGDTAALLRQAGIDVLTYPSGEEFLQRYKECPPECVVTQLCLAGISGLEVQRRLLRMVPAMPIIFAASEASARSVLEAMKQGATDFLLEPSENVGLLDAVHRALEASAILQVPRDWQAEGDSRLHTLTARELEILELVVDGLASKVIADRLGLSKRTVDVHRRHIMSKIGVQSVADLVKHALGRRGPRPPGGGAEKGPLRSVDAP